MDRNKSLKSLKNLALPFVITAAPLGACVIHKEPIPQPQQETASPIQVNQNNPSKTIEAARSETAKAIETKKTEELPKAPLSGGEVSVSPNGTCWWNMTFTSAGCPEGAICNPPPPRQVECPDELKKK